jgi:hypothetical protein
MGDPTATWDAVAVRVTDICPNSDPGIDAKRIAEMRSPPFFISSSTCLKILFSYKLTPSKQVWFHTFKLF